MSKFEIPKDLTDLDIDALSALISDGRKAAADLVSADEPTNEDIAAAQEIVDFIAQAKERVASIESENAMRAETLEALRAATAEEPEAEDKAEEPEAVEVASVTEDEQENPTEEASASEENTEEEKVAVTASQKSAVESAAANAKPVEVATETVKQMTITAAADIAGFSSGQTLSNIEEVTKAAMKRLKSFPKGSANKQTRLQQGIAEFNIASARDDGLYQGNPDYKTDQDVLVAASSESRLSGGSLVAAGGWCAPAEIIYDFCSEVSTDGILSLPTMNVSSGSVQYTKGPDFATIFANANGDWNLTEAEVIADTEKPCIAVECPDWDTITLDATGVCVSAGILTNAAYPELVKAYIDNVLIAHQHKVAQRMYAGIDAAATTLTGVTGTTNSEGLSVLETVIEYVKSSKRMSMGTSMEVLLPAWYKSSIRWDFANKNGMKPQEVTDQMIDAAFKVRGLSVQWLYNTGQDITEPLADGALTVPTSVDALFYRAGTFVRLSNDLITLDGVYDSTNIKTNTYTALFTEEGIGLAQMCGDAYKVALPVCTSGQMGALDIACA